MATTSEALATAIAHHQAGRLQAAQQIYLAILAAEPNQPDALHLHGLIHHQSGNYEYAAATIERAIQLNGDNPIFHNNLGESYRALRRLPEAIASYRRALQIRPGFAGFYYNLGNALKDDGQLAEAIACYQRAIEIEPAHAAAHNNLGNAWKAQGQLSQAIACYQRAVEINPAFADAHNNLGIAWNDQRQSEAAIASLRRALELAPNHAEAHSNLGNALQRQGELAQAIASHQRALQLKPDFAEGHFNLAFTWHMQGQLTQAIECYRRALELKSDYSAGYNNLANAWKDQGELAEAIACFERARQLDPEHTEAHSNALLTLHYQADVSLAKLAAAHAEYEREHAAPLRRVQSSKSKVQSRGTEEAGVQSPESKVQSREVSERRLRVGFVSPDLARHPVGYFLIRVLENLDAAQCEVVCYHDRWSADDLTARFQAAAHVWRPVVGQTDEQLAEQIRADRIDILVDLTGHTAHNRLLVFARKPAPVQMTWIGYEGTTGLAAMDYILGDRHVIPPGAEPHYREHVLRMPHGWLCYDPPAEAPAVGPLPAIANGYPTFGSFNNLAKITLQVVATWAKILTRLPTSRLILKYRGLEDLTVQQRFLQMFADNGVGAEQLDLRPQTPFADYLATYGQVDLTLDPFPFAGGTVTCESMWMGVPVVTCPGETFASRHSLSHLSNIGLTETIARDLPEYVDLAVALASDLSRLAALREGLRQRMADSPLCDGKQFAAGLLPILRAAWRRWVEHGD